MFTEQSLANQAFVPVSEPSYNMSMSAIPTRGNLDSTTYDGTLQNTGHE